MKTRNSLLAGVVLCLSLGGRQAIGGPTNDNFVDAAVLVGTSVTVEGDNWGAGSEPGEDAGGGNIYYFDSVWYAWTAPTNGVVHITGSTGVPNFYMSIRVFRGSAVSALTAAESTPDGGIPVTTGDTISIQVASIYYPVWGGGGGMGQFTLGLALEVPAATSPNDAFAGALAINTATYHFDGSMYGATTEPGEPLPATGLTRTLWWKLASAQDWDLNLTATAPQFTPAVTVYTGANLGSLTPVLPLASSVYRLRAGTNYLIQLSASNVYAGAFSFDARCYAISNDFFANAEPLEGTNFVYSGNFTGATLEPGEPIPPATNTVWAAWAAPYTGRVYYSLLDRPAGPGDIQYCIIYSGASLTNLQPVPVIGAGYRTYSFLATAGTVYHLQFCGGMNNFNLSMSVTPLLACTNDNFADATVVKGNVIYFDLASVVGATMEIGEPAHWGAVPQASIWWQWQAPTDGALYISSSGLVPTVLLAVYTGDSVQALRLVAKGTNGVSFPIVQSEIYHIAGVVPTNSVGDIGNYGQVSNQPLTSRIVPGNLLREPSWEGTGILGAQYWHWSGDMGGYVNERGGADGMTWPTLGVGTTVWQDITTTPGHQYKIKFAYRMNGCGDVVQVSWASNVVGTAGIACGDVVFWHWASFVAWSSNVTTRVSFHNLQWNVDVDAFSVVDMSAPPAIINQPTSISTVAGGTAAFSVGASGSTPLQYQWFFNGAPLGGQTTAFLIINSVRTNDTGDYKVTITNAFGAVTSAPATLLVDAPIYPTIVWQPYGDTVTRGAWYSFNVAAIGTPPLEYQWFFNGTLIRGATNNSLVLTNVGDSDIGTYQVTVQNPAGSVLSLPAMLRQGAAVAGGAQLVFANRGYGCSSNLDAPVFDVDAITPLSGSNFVAQLYAGPSLELLRPAGEPVPFRTGFFAGYVAPQMLTLANVAPGCQAVVQVRAWEAARGNTYEAARALGGRFGKSELLEVMTGGGMVPPGCLEGLGNFSLHAGLPEFTVGRLQFVERQPQNVVVWAVVGEPGYHYLVEKADRTFVWTPFKVVLNATGTVTFTDTASSGSATTFYRARIID